MFQVEWIQAALDALTDVWAQANSAERRQVTAAAHQLEERLRRSPFTEGESRTVGRRIAFAAPLKVTYRIEADGKTVTIVEVRFFRSRKP